MESLRKIRKNSESDRRLRYYDFGPFRIDLFKRLLLREGVPLALTPKAFETLVVLVENRGDVLLKEELLERIWPDTVVEEGSLSRNISTLRAVLGESRKSHEYVVTVPRRGYRFVGEVREARGEPLWRSGELIQSLAVLPFANLSGDSGQEYFADGLTEALITDLARIRSLQVVSRTSVMRYKNTRNSLPEIASELHVDGVIEGSVIREGRRVRIMVQLVEGQTDRHLWANTYEGELGDLLGLQSAMAQAILAEIRAALTPAQKARLATVRVVSPKAYEAYLKGRHLWNRRTLASLKRSEVYFEQAIRTDPGYALALVGLAQTHLVMLDYGFHSPQALAPKALQAVQRALELDSELGEAYTAFALLKLVREWDFVGAEQQFRTALDLSPGDPTAYQWYGVLLMYQRRFDEAVHQMVKAQSLDPLAPILRAALGLVYVLAGKYNEAMAQAETARELEPTFPQTYAVLGLVSHQRGEYPRAIVNFKRYVELSGKDPDALMRLGCAYAKSGRRDDAAEILEALRTRSVRNYVPPGSLAAVELALGDAERALAELEAGLEQRATSLLMLAVDPAFASLRPHSGFQSLLRKIGLPL